MCKLLYKGSIMQKKVNFGFKFALVVFGMGMLSPSFNLDTATDMKSSYSSISIPKIDITLFNQAEAAPVHRQARRVSRRTSRRTSRRVSYRHNVAYGGGRYYGGGHYHHHHHHHTGAAVAAGVVTGMAVGAAVATPKYY